MSAVVTASSSTLLQRSTGGTIAEGGKAILFGGAGFIGTHLARHLLAEGCRVVSADIAESRAPVLGVDYRHCDVRNPIPDDIAAGATVAFNLAAVHRTPGHPDHEYFETNVAGARNITEYCARVGIHEIVFTSSIAVYGPGEAAKSEEAEPNPVSAYGKSKLAAEGIHTDWQAADPVRRLVMARPAVVFGDGENGNFTRLARALAQRTFVYPGRRDTIKACGWVGELISSLDFARHLARPRLLYNFCYPEAYTIEDICRAFQRVGALPPPLFTAPSGLMNTAAMVFEGLNRLGVRNEISRARIGKLQVSTHIVPGTLAAVGYDWNTDLEAGLAEWRASAGGRFV